ncbi:nitronate monooxygenase family protein [Actinomycetospora corticicola]|uniref:NAD(P)H-dependent flavin oxidoreductase YrpB (Nitropropane dioxygenase family) n=1 Tax=Actinomycetospora corticicola TaxID=663602 RepID=A0A7Y9DRM1_9PSEU|nr:nitronate monooxygenase [Actinomycetospora corticicola]NYD33917.1 NAD(P)H-dependent flavin oxidoreductase YrpB (nitropropane dioxygenase family) [Actinomycetospora corticicola]
MRTALTELLGVEHPLVGFNRSPAVVAAVTNAGGYGVLAASMYTPAELDAQLHWIEEQVQGRPYGVDLLVPEKFAVGDPDQLVASLRAQIPDEHRAFVDALLEEYGVPADAHDPREDTSDEIAAAINPAGAEALLDVAFSHRISMVANALGPPPADLVERAHAAGIVVASLVGARKHAERQLAAGVDVLVAQGTEAGGHTGTVATTVLTPEVVEIADGRPVLAAGGIATGDQMAAALALGAAGVWCGSVWLGSHEDITPLPVKEKFLAAGSSDTLRSRTITGKPARQLRSAWHDAWDRPDAPAPLPLPLQPMLIGRVWDRVHDAAAAGNPGAIALDTYFIGQVVGGFRELRGAGDITRDMVDGCRARLRALGELASS